MGLLFQSHGQSINDPGLPCSGWAGIEVMIKTIYRLRASDGVEEGCHIVLVSLSYLSRIVNSLLDPVSILVQGCTAD